MKRYSVCVRVLACVLTLLMLVAALTACGASANPAKPDEKTVVGTVDGEKIYYDELYFLVNRYMESAKKTYGEDTDALRTELDRLFRENVLSSYAMLRLCEKHGLTLDEKEWKDEINAEVDALVYEYYNEDRKLMDADMEKLGLSERYLRYLLATDLLYSQLLYVYPEKGLVPTKESELLRRINDEFIHVYHLAIFDDEGDDPAANRAKINEAHHLLKSGEKSMYDLIKAGYSEDFSDVSASGEYIISGTMDEAYENAAFSLRIGQVSGVVEAMGENNDGQLVPCYYVIQRFEMDETYVKSHFTELVDEYYGSVIAADLAEIKKTLSFEPSELYGELDLANLPKFDTDNTVLVIVLLSLGCALAIAAVVAVILIKRKHARKNISYAGKQKALAKGERHERS